MTASNLGCFFITKSGDDVLLDDETTTAVSVDLDGDGYVGDDCDDNDSLVNPGMPETCGDGVDQDCDGSDASCGDLDGDGYATEDGDCDDADAGYYPGAPEEDCTDPNDYNCDGSTGYADNDADGWAACEDCDDTDSDVYPSATETWYDGEDADCDGASDYDADADGYDSANFGGDDCDDLEPAANPGGTETCDDIDNDCDGLVDDDVGDAYYLDNDGDGYGDAGGIAAVTCDPPAGYVENALDCDDAAGGVSPVASEVCNGVDDDCDGSPEADEVDADGDLVLACEDCDDADATRSPLLSEVCGDGIDNDCDAANDASGDTWYADADGDGYGDAASTVVQCDEPTGYVVNADDCDDADGGANPAATETCDGTVDENCDGSVDENSASDARTWYADSDGDGYGGASAWYEACEQPSGYVENADDCDDAAAGTNPGTTEVCDEITDEDCDGSIDEGVTTRYYLDLDSDEWGSRTLSIDECSLPDGYVTDNTDCDDTDPTLQNDDADSDGDTTCDGDCDDADASLDLDDMDGDGYSSCDGECNDSEREVNPGATEVCDGTDNDCDGSADDGLTFATYYGDDDSDGYGDATDTIYQCEQPAGYVENADDCDDGDYTVNPGEAESCDGEDNDCDGSTDEDFDADADGSLSAAECGSYGTDCDDADAAVNTSASEVCDDIDNDCDGSTDEDFDADGDGYASAADCAYGDDCDDADPYAFPQNRELEIGEDANCLDGADNDCDGNADAADWDCQNDDGDYWEMDNDGLEDDPIYNGVDALYAVDNDGGGSDDTICVVVSYVVDSSYASDDGVRQGTPTATWGGFSSVDTANTDTISTISTDAWCFDFGASGLADTRYRYRYVASSTAGASSCSGWTVSDFEDFCDMYRDEWCTEYGTGSNPCGYNWVIGVDLQADGSITPD